MAIQKTLDLSTAHLTPKDMSIMEDACDLFDDDARIFPVRITSHQHGWVLFLPDEEHKPDSVMCRKKGLSDHFIAALEYAYQHKCMFIVFDKDAPGIHGLPVDNHNIVQVEGTSL